MEPHTDRVSRYQTLGDPRSIRRVAVFRALFLGDLLCATPALRALRERFPAAEISLIGLPWARELVERLPYLDRWLPFPGYPGIPEVASCPEQTAAFLAQARAYRYDLAFQMHGDGRVSNGFVAGLGAQVALGYRRGPDRRLDLSLPCRDGEHETLRWLRLVQTDWSTAAAQAACHDDRAQSPTPGAQALRLDFPLSELDRARADELLYRPSEAPLVGMHPGSKLQSRRWPVERFAALADALIERYGAKIVLTGGAAERHLTASLRRAMRHPALDLAGETNLGAFAAVIARLDLLVTNDTGASHLAAASRTPSVVLFGPSRPDEWAPLDRERHRAIDAWALAGRPANPEAALRQLPVERVLEACSTALGRNERAVGAQLAAGNVIMRQQPGIKEPSF